MRAFYENMCYNDLAMWDQTEISTGEGYTEC